MAFKNKITWQNQNVLSDAVVIYKSNSTFTSATKPEPLVTITDPTILQYEDMEVEDGKSYYYMLSAKLQSFEKFSEVKKVDIGAISSWSYFAQTIVPYTLTDSGETINFVNINANTDANILKPSGVVLRNAQQHGKRYFEFIVVERKKGTSAQTILEPYGEISLGIAENNVSIAMNKDSSGSPHRNGTDGRYMFGNDLGWWNILASGGSLASKPSPNWAQKLADFPIRVGQVIGVSIEPSGSNCLVKLWINGVYKCDLFTISGGAATNYKPHIWVSTSNTTTTRVRLRKTLTYLPAGYTSWYAD